MKTRHFAPLCAALWVALSPLPALASCGSAFCTLMTDRYAQGTGNPHVGWSADLRIERVTQDQLRSGTHDIDASQVTDEDAIERHTKNLNVVTTLGYGFDASWSMSLRACMKAPASRSSPKRVRRRWRSSATLRHT